MTRLDDGQIIREKFFTGILNVGALIAVSIPIFALLGLLGGATPQQIFEVELVCFGSAILAGAQASTLAAWRDKSFQAIALSIMAVILALLIAEALSAGAQAVGRTTDEAQRLASFISSFRALQAALNPLPAALAPSVPSAVVYFGVACLGAATLLAYAAFMLRRWYPQGEPIMQREGVGADGVAPSEQPYRVVQGNPILWRETRTAAYGTRTILIKLMYLAICGLVVALAWRDSFGAQLERNARVKALLKQSPERAEELLDRSREPGSVGFTAAVVGIAILCLLLVNAQAASSITTERDLKALDLVLATRVTPPEFLAGKLVGALRNMWLPIAVPALLLAAGAWAGLLDWVGLTYSLVLLALLVGWAAILGVHAALRYDTSRIALGHSMGTMFLLFVGMLVCLFLILASGNGRFGAQWASFLLFIGFGSIGLWLSLSANAPSAAITLAASTLPFATFYCIVSFVVGDRTAPFLVGSAAYGFAIAALLVPLLAEFDVATGRTSHAEGA